MSSFRGVVRRITKSTDGVADRVKDVQQTKSCAKAHQNNIK